VDGEHFFMTSYAFGPNGTVYADEIPGGGGFEPHEQLIAWSGDHAELLWQQANRATVRCRRFRGACPAS